MSQQTDPQVEQAPPRTHCIFCAADLTVGDDRTDLGYCAFCREDEV